jgi:hypothetical protein
MRTQHVTSIVPMLGHARTQHFESATGRRTTIIEDGLHCCPVHIIAVLVLVTAKT